MKLNKTLLLYPILILTLVFVNGCAAGVSDTWVKPIYLERSDLVCMARTTKEQILTHNETLGD